jgi:hypothetical protein
MWHVGEGAQRVTDAMARAVIDPVDRRAGKPRRLLTHQPRGELVGARQRLGKQPQRMQRQRVAIWVCVDRAQRLDGMVDAANAGRQPQPFGRVYRDLRIEDDGARSDIRSDEGMLLADAFIGDAGEIGE